MTPEVDVVTCKACTWKMDTCCHDGVSLAGTYGRSAGQTVCLNFGDWSQTVWPRVKLATSAVTLQEQLSNHDKPCLECRACTAISRYAICTKRG